MKTDFIAVSARSFFCLAKRHTAVFFVLILMFPYAHADQCEYFDVKTANLVQSIIKTGDMLLHYCEPCAMPEPEPLRVNTMHIEKETLTPKTTNINGVWYTYDEIRADKVPGMTSKERDILLESIARDTPADYLLIINGESRDLAYLYYHSTPEDKNYKNIGMAAGCADGVSPVITYTFPDKGQTTEQLSNPHYEDITGICYDGSCLLDTWTLSTEAPLFTDYRVDGEAGAKYAAGEILYVERIVSEIHPVLAQVIFDHGRFLKGDEFYILNSLGEGFHRVWYYGRVVEEDLSGVSMQQMETGEWTKCPEPDVDCWAEASGYPEEIWWALVKTSDGKQGWLRDPASFIENIYELE